MNNEQAALIIYYWRVCTICGIRMTLDQAAAAWIKSNAAQYRKEIEA